MSEAILGATGSRVPIDTKVSRDYFWNKHSKNDDERVDANRSEEEYRFDSSSDDNSSGVEVRPVLVKGMLSGRRLVQKIEGIPTQEIEGVPAPTQPAFVNGESNSVISGQPGEDLKKVAVPFEEALAQAQRVYTDENSPYTKKPVSVGEDQVTEVSAPVAKPASTKGFHPFAWFRGKKNTAALEPVSTGTNSEQQLPGWPSEPEQPLMPVGQPEPEPEPEPEPVHDTEESEPVFEKPVFEDPLATSSSSAAPLIAPDPSAPADGTPVVPDPNASVSYTVVPAQNAAPVASDPPAAPEGTSSSASSAAPIASTTSGVNNGGGANPTVSEKLSKAVNKNIQNKILMQSRGQKAIASAIEFAVGADEDIHLVATEKISRKEMKKEAASIAYEAIDVYEDRAKKERAGKDAAKEMLRLSQGKKQHGMFYHGLKRVVNCFGDRIVGTARRTIAIKKYYKVALAAMDKTGHRDAARMAAIAFDAELQKKSEAAIERKKLTRKERKSGDRRDYNMFNATVGKTSVPKESWKDQKERIVKEVAEDKTRGRLMTELFNVDRDDLAAKYFSMDPDRALADRAERAARNRGSALDIDKGIKLSEQKGDNPIMKAMIEFGVEVSAYDDAKLASSDARERKFEQQKRARAREKVIKAFNDNLGGTVNNATEAIRLIERNLSGVKHVLTKDGAMRAVDATRSVEEYMRQRFHFDKFEVTKSGLPLKEKKVSAKFSDAIAIKSNIGLGLAVGLGSTIIVGLARNNLMKRLTDSQVGLAAAKVLIATAVGAQRGYSKAKKEQLKENIDASLGKDVTFKPGFIKHNRKMGKDFGSMMLDIEETTVELMQELKTNGNPKDLNERVKELGDVLARLMIEEKHAGKVSLFKYSRGEAGETNLKGYNIERGRADLLKAVDFVMNELKQSGVADIENRVKESREKQFKALNKEYWKVASNQIAWRWGRAALTGAMAGAVAAFSTITYDRFFGGRKLENEIKEIASGAKKLKFEGFKLNIVSTDSAAGMAATTSGAEKLNNATKSQNPGEQNAQKNGPINQDRSRGLGQDTKQNGPIDQDRLKGGTAPGGEKDGSGIEGISKEEFEARVKSQVIIEDDPQGGQAIGFDKNGNGKIDDGEYLFGKGDEPGINLNDSSEFVRANEKLNPYGYSIEGEPVVNNLPTTVKVGAYTSAQTNVAPVNINKVNWTKSQQLVSMEGPITLQPTDGVEWYKVPIDGDIPDGAELFVDLDGNGPALPLRFPIKDGYALVPPDVIEKRTSGAIKLLGISRVGKIENDEIISFTTNSGKILSSDDVIHVNKKEVNTVITVYKHASDGKTFTNNQAVLDANNKTVSNISETFNGTMKGGSKAAMPYMLTEREVAPGSTPSTLANGGKIPDLEYHGGYKKNFDPSINDVFKEKPSYVGPANISPDIDGDGVIGAAEGSQYVNQMFVRTATNPYVLAQNASVYGLLEPDKLSSIGLTPEVLRRFGITDGKVDTMEELNLLMEALKESDNAELYDNLVNATLKVMREELTGAEFEITVLGAREASYLEVLENGSETARTVLGKINASRSRVAVTYFKTIDGKKVYIGNKKGLFGDGKKPVYDMLACEQKGVEKPPVSTPPKTPPTPPPEEETPPPSTPTPPPEETPPPSTPTPPPEETPPPSTPTPPPDETPPPETPLPPKNDPDPMLPKPGDGDLPEPTPVPNPGPITKRPRFGDGNDGGDTIVDDSMENWIKVEQEAA